jgi:cathepsin L
LALTYVQGLSGARLVDAEDAPYKAVAQKCTETTTSLLDSGAGEGGDSGSYGVTGWQTLPSNKAGPLMAALVDGPVAVAVSAELWFMYYDGIFDSCDRDSVIDHAVVMVGYGTEGGTGYWTIRNSWGEDWGEHGHIRLLRHDTAEEDDKFCGTDRRPGEGMACKPYPTSVEVCGMCGVLYDSVVADFSPSTSATKSSKY